MRKNGIDLEQMTPRSVAGFVRVIGAAVALLAFVWKFGLEEFVDPMLPGDHSDEHPAERSEFVIAATLFALAAATLPSSLVSRLVKKQLREVAAVDAVFAVAQRCLQCLAPPCPIDSPSAASVAVSASIGIALFPNHAAHADALLHCADMAMYEVKRRGRNACGLYAGAEPAHSDAAPS